MPDSKVPAGESSPNGYAALPRRMRLVLLGIIENEARVHRRPLPLAAAPLPCGLSWLRFSKTCWALPSGNTIRQVPWLRFFK
jgi:hypothetical protein